MSSSSSSRYSNIYIDILKLKKITFCGGGVTSWDIVYLRLVYWEAKYIFTIKFLNYIEQYLSQHLKPTVPSIMVPKLPKLKIVLIEKMYFLCFIWGDLLPSEITITEMFTKTFWFLKKKISFKIMHLRKNSIISNDGVQIVVLPAPPHQQCAASLHYAVLPTSPSLTPLIIHSFHLPASLHPPT